MNFCEDRFAYTIKYIDMTKANLQTADKCFKTERDCQGRSQVGKNNHISDGEVLSVHHFLSSFPV